VNNSARCRSRPARSTSSGRQTHSSDDERKRKVNGCTETRGFERGWCYIVGPLSTNSLHGARLYDHSERPPRQGKTSASPREELVFITGSKNIYATNEQSCRRDRQTDRPTDRYRVRRVGSTIRARSSAIQQWMTLDGGRPHRTT